MTCEKEMNLFFVRNCYSEKEREKVKQSAAYQLAVEKNDATQAQEFACRILEDRPLNS
jgi:isoaspartyl peptidase/L-asparaginase-like protein (Ntn-hydrolase superfamily)